MGRIGERKTAFNTCRDTPRAAINFSAWEVNFPHRKQRNTNIQSTKILFFGLWINLINLLLFKLIFNIKQHKFDKI